MLALSTVMNTARNARFMAGGYHVLEVVPSRRHVSLSKEGGQDVQDFAEAQPRPPEN